MSIQFNYILFKDINVHVSSGQCAILHASLLYSMSFLLHCLTTTYIILPGIMLRTFFYITWCQYCIIYVLLRCYYHDFAWFHVGDIFESLFQRLSLPCNHDAFRWLRHWSWMAIILPSMLCTEHIMIVMMVVTTFTVTKWWFESFLLYFSCF